MKSKTESYLVALFIQRFCTVLKYHQHLFHLQKNILITRTQVPKWEATLRIFKLTIQFNKEIHKGKISISPQKDQSKILLTCKKLRIR
jgi:hypothetical protein